MLRLCERDGAVYPKEKEVRAKVKELLSRADVKPALLHGDLWTGNAGFTADGEGCIFDPGDYLSACSNRNVYAPWAATLLTNLTYGKAIVDVLVVVVSCAVPLPDIHNAACVYSTDLYFTPSPLHPVSHASKQLRTTGTAKQTLP